LAFTASPSDIPAVRQYTYQAGSACSPIDKYMLINTFCYLGQVYQNRIEGRDLWCNCTSENGMPTISAWYADPSTNFTDVLYQTLYPGKCTINKYGGTVIYAAERGCGAVTTYNIESGGGAQSSQGAVTSPSLLPPFWKAFEKYLSFPFYVLSLAAVWLSVFGSVQYFLI
jgi:hypothetical protein